MLQAKTLGWVAIGMIAMFSFLTVIPTQADPSNQAEWEYMVVPISLDDYPDRTNPGRATFQTTVLNNMAADGWEFVHAALGAGHTLYFKRRR